MSIRFDAPALAAYRKHIMERGRTLATLLSQVLAGKLPPAVTALLDAKPGKRPEEVLRLALDEVEARRKLIDAGDDRFGRCDICGVDLGADALLEMPWADRCHAHATL
jgi:RNA polymerase-binding transcription factor DksA